MLFRYGALLKDAGLKDVEALRQNIPELLAVAEEVRRRSIVGLMAYKPANSHSENEQSVFNFVGMMGVPLVPCHEFPAEAKAAFFSMHALKDPNLPEELAAFIATGRPIVLTDALAKQLSGKVNLSAPNVYLLPVKGDPKSLLGLPQAELDAMRATILRPLGHTFRAPNRVALYLFADGSWVVENFRDEAVNVDLDGTTQTISPRGWLLHWNPSSSRRHPGSSRPTT
jgi:hypothetical protein